MQKTKDLAKSIRLGNLTSEEENRINQQFFQIGKMYYDLYKDNPPDAFVQMFHEIEASRARIATYAQLQDALKGTSRCASCGADNTDHSAFCNSCGKAFVSAQTAVSEKNCPGSNPHYSEMNEKTSMYCTKCRNTVSKTTKFCGKCGEPNPHYTEISAPAKQQIYNTSFSASSLSGMPLAKVCQITLVVCLAIFALRWLSIYIGNRADVANRIDDITNAMSYYTMFGWMGIILSVSAIVCIVLTKWKVATGVTAFTALITFGMTGYNTGLEDTKSRVVEDWVNYYASEPFTEQTFLVLLAVIALAALIVMQVKFFPKKSAKSRFEG